MADHYRTQIKRLKYAGLLRLWRLSAAGSSLGWPAGKAFEYLILRAFEIEGADVQYPFSVNLPSGINEQIDGVIYHSGLAAIVESKDRGTLNVEPIAKLRNQLARRPAATIGVIFSRKGFTLPALALTQYMSPQTVLVWPGAEIDLALRKKRMLRGLHIKYKMAVEQGMPDASLLLPGVL
jgi:hypothetical protein